VTTAQDAIGIGPAIYSRREITETVERLAACIARDYRGQPLTLLGVLKGALCFTADLSRALARKADGPSEILMDYVVVERYGASGTSGRSARLAGDCKVKIRGAHVLIADGIVDHGVTLAFVGKLIRERGPASLRSCALFHRPAARRVEVKPDYVGSEVGERFVIGYGLDYKELYRNLPCLAELREG